MIAADSKNINDEYNILNKELEEYNPELLNKKRVLAITKSDIIDDELEKLINDELPKNIPTIFISSLANKNILQLKDILWKILNS